MPTRLDSAPDDANAFLRDQFIDRASFDGWAAEYRQVLQAEGSQNEQRRENMNTCNPQFILRNYLAEAIRKAEDEQAYSEIERLLGILRTPFTEQPEHESYAAAPPDWAAGLHVSGSS